MIGARAIASAPRRQGVALKRPPTISAAASANVQGQSGRGIHGRAAIGATTAPTKSSTHWACKTTRAASPPPTAPRARRARRTQAVPASKAMPGMQGR